jgi:hypothetical protein
LKKEAEEIPISKHFFDEYEKLIKECLSRDDFDLFWREIASAVSFFFIKKSPFRRR